MDDNDIWSNTNPNDMSVEAANSKEMMTESHITKQYTFKYNPTDVSIDTANNEEMIADSHITKFHTHKHKGSVTTKLLNKVSNTPGAAPKHNIGQGQNNRSNTQTTTFVDCKLATCKNESFFL